MHAHRSLRHLANALARTGFPVLRFDYHGTGDSPGADEDPDRHATWLANTRDAISWMQCQLHCDRVSLIGLRLGASLAAAAAAENPVENLLMWAPVIKGRQYVREMHALSLTAGTRPQPSPNAPDDIEAAGFVLTKQTLDDLGKIDLLTAQPKCRRVLIVARDDLPDNARLRTAWAGLGLDVEQIRQPGYAAMMAEPHLTKVPYPAIAAIVQWQSAGSRQPAAGSRQQAAGSEVHSLLPAARCPLPAISLPAISERLVPISQEPNLFGILSEPNIAPAEDLPLIVLTNAGSAYRVGPNRLHVMLARHLAARGFRSLHSICAAWETASRPTSRRRTSPMQRPRFATCTSRCTMPSRTWAQGACVFMGLCSGAYVAFQAAARFADPALVESVLINPLTFFWKDGMTQETAPNREIKRQHYYWRLGAAEQLVAAADRQNPTRHRRRRQVAHGTLLAAAGGNGCGGVSGEPAPRAGELGHPTVDDLAADLERVAGAGRHLACFLSESDPGYRILMHQAQKKATSLRQAGKLDVSFIRDADHTFTASRRRRELIQLIVAHLCRRTRRRVGSGPK